MGKILPALKTATTTQKEYGSAWANTAAYFADGKNAAPLIAVSNKQVAVFT